MKPLTKAEHLQKAAHNERFFDSVFGNNLDQNAEYLDWATTVIFYSALHYVDAALCHIGREAHNHDDRRKHITIQPALKAIQSPYKWLYDRSRDARYCNLPSDITRTRVISSRTDEFSRIKDHVQKVIK